MQETTRWRKGVSGNPAGKPKGARHKTTLAVQALLDGEAEALTRKCIELAKEGDTTALRLCMERLAPAIFAYYSAESSIFARTACRRRYEGSRCSLPIAEAQASWLDEPSVPCTGCTEDRPALAFQRVWSVMLDLNVTFRPAQAKDALHLASLYDLASRGLAAWSWNQMAEPGQSLIEVGRHRIAENSDHVSHFSSWIVAEIDGSIAGAILGYRIPDPYDARCRRHDRHY
jgi:hypothetical protein